MSSLEVPEIQDHTLKNIFCSNAFTFCAMTNETIRVISDSLIKEQIFLDELLYVYQNLIVPFQKKGGATRESNVYETLCRCHKELLNIHVLHVKTLCDYYNHAIEAHEVTIIANADECICIYRSYLNTICDIIALSGFVQIAKLVDVLEVLSNVFKEKVDSKDANISNEFIIAFVLQQPLQHLIR